MQIFFAKRGPFGYGLMWMLLKCYQFGFCPFCLVWIHKYNWVILVKSKCVPILFQPYFIVTQSGSFNHTKTISTFTCNYYYDFLKSISSSISHWKNSGTPWLRNFSFFLYSIFVYEPILIKNYMNANVIKTQFFIR